MTKLFINFVNTLVFNEDIKLVNRTSSKRKIIENLQDDNLKFELFNIDSSDNKKK